MVEIKYRTMVLLGVQEYGLTGKGHKETFSGDGNALTLTEVWVV